MTAANCGYRALWIETLRSPDLIPWPTGTRPDIAMCGEEEREGVLAQYGLDVLEDDPELTSIVRFAAKLCETPVALVSLVERERQIFLAREGLTERSTPREVSFCAHAMLKAEPTVIEDTTKDPRFAENPLVTGPSHVRFYAGAPLISGEGAPLGTLCVVDGAPRPGGLTELQHEGLIVLAAAVMRRLRHRREARAAIAESALSEKRLQTLADSIPDIAWSADPKGNLDYCNRRWYEFTGLPAGELPGDAPHLLHEEDLESFRSGWQHALETGEPYESQLRLRRADGEFRWMLSRGLPVKTEGGTIERWFGTLTDIHESRRESEAHDLLARELSHRIKNIFAVVTGLIALRSRRRPETREFADDLNATIRALGRAHDFVRPIEGAKGDSLAGVIGELMAPYRDEGDERIVMSGKDCEIGARAATPLALVFHELATNSAKYGALSNDVGTVTIDIDCGETLIVTWRERGAPPPQAGEEGFGSRLVEMAVKSQLGGEIERKWHEDGLEVVLRIPAEMIAS